MDAQVEVTVVHITRGWTYPVDGAVKPSHGQTGIWSCTVQNTSGFHHLHQKQTALIPAALTSAKGSDIILTLT